MLFNQFIDREGELSELKVFFLSARGLRKVVVVTGASGVGKSEFTEEFVRRARTPLFIRVPCPVPPCDKTVKDGIFIRNVSEQLHRVASRHALPTMEQFANQLGTHALTEDYHKRLLEDGRRLSSFAALHSLLQIIRRKRRRLYTAVEMYRPSATWEPIIHRDYILHALRDEEATLALENYQLIDQESLLHVHDLIRNLPKVSWIVEYTASSRSDAELRAFDEFQRLCEKRAKLLTLPPVPLSEIVSASAGEFSDNTEIIEQQYRAHGGNLRVLLDTSSLLQDSRKAETLRTRTKEDGNADPTVILLETFAAGPLFLLAIVFANDARVEACVAEAIFRGQAQALGLGDYTSACLAIVAANVLVEDGSLLKLAHDRVADAFATGASRRLTLTLAFRASADFYETYLRIRQHDLLPEREVAARLLKIRLQTEPLMIFAHLQQLRDAVLGSASRHDASRFLESAVSALRREIGVAEHAWWRLAHLCYEANLFDLALKVSADRGDSVRWRLLRGLALHNLDQNEEGIREAEAVLAQTGAAGARLAALLLRMVCLRAAARLPEAEETVAAIQQESSFRDEPEYAYFLRNLESLRSPQEGLLLARESVRLLREHGLVAQENKARITLAMQLARTGQCDEALAELRIVEQLDRLPITDRHMVWNNRCATEMMRGNWQSEQGFLLGRATLTCSIDFDRIAVGNNLALWHAHRGEIGAAYRQFAEIAPLVEAENDTRILCALFFNQAQVAQLAGDEASELEWRGKLRREAPKVDGGYRDYWLARSHGANAANEEIGFLLSRPFHYLFLAHWSFPLRSDIEG